MQTSAWGGKKQHYGRSKVRSDYMRANTMMLRLDCIITTIGIMILPLDATSRLIPLGWRGESISMRTQRIIRLI